MLTSPLNFCRLIFKQTYMEEHIFLVLQTMLYCRYVTYLIIWSSFFASPSKLNRLLRSTQLELFIAASFFCPSGLFHQLWSFKPDPATCLQIRTVNRSSQCEFPVWSICCVFHRIEGRTSQTCQNSHKFLFLARISTSI